MKYILGIMCLITAMICYIYPELITKDIHLVLGCIFVLLGNLFITKKIDK